jgi:hypothetical protein
MTNKKEFTYQSVLYQVIFFKHWEGKFKFNKKLSFFYAIVLFGD